MTTFLLSPGPFCGQCGHPQRTNRAYRCQSCACTTSHRFATTTRTKKDTRSASHPSPVGERVRGGGNLSTRPAQRVPFLRALRRAGWVDLLPLFTGALVLMAVAMSVRVDPWTLTDLLFAAIGAGLVGWGLANSTPK